MNKKRTTMFLLAGAILAVAFFALGANIATDLVREKFTEAVKESLDSQITLGEVKGNPFRGYRIEDVSLSADGSELFSARRIKAKVSLISLITGGAPVSLLEIVGFSSDVERINRLIPRIKPGEEGGQLPFEKVRLTDSQFGTSWAQATIRAVTLSLDGDRIDTNLDISVNDLPVRGDLDVSMADKVSAIRRMDLRIGEGKISASGEVMPELFLKGNAKDLDVSRLVSFWPDADPELYNGLVSLEFTAERTWQDPEISGDFLFSGSLLSGIPVEKASARWRFLNNRLDVADLDVFILGFPLNGSLAFVFDPKSPPRMRVDLKGAAANLEALSRISEKLQGMSGTLDNFSVFLEGQVSNPEGQISFEARELGYRDLSTSNTSINARIRGGNINITGKSNFEGAPLTLGGTVSNFMRSPVTALQGTLRSLSLGSLDKLVPAMQELDLRGSVNSDYRISGPVQAMSVSGKLWSDKISVGQHSLERPSSFFDYDLKEDALSFSDMKASWKKAAISGKGKITSLTSDERAGDLSLQASNLDSAFFSSFYPQISEYRLKGEMSVEALVKGPLSGPSVRVGLLSRSLSLMDSYSFTNLKAGTNINDLKAGIPSDLQLDITADSASIAGAELKTLDLELEKKAKVLTVKKGNASIGEGSLSAGGSATLEDPAERTTLNLTLKAANIDLEKVKLKGGEALPLAGTLNGDVAVTGRVDDPRVSVNAAAPFIAAAGLKIDSVKMKVSGNTSTLKIEDISGKVGEGSMAVTGDVGLAPFAADLAINGKSLELNPLLSRFEKLKSLNITGKADLEFRGLFSEGKNNGSGKATSPSVRVMGMEITNVVIPLVLDGNRLTSPDGTGRIYGGQLMNDLALNLSGMTFYNEIEVKDTDVNALLKDAFKLQGNITGKAELFAKINGSLGKEFKYTGKGLFKTGQGMITGFKIIDLVAAVHRSRGLHFASVYAPFDLQTGKLILAEDTLVKAPEGDPLYEFLVASGGIGPEKKLDLACNGKINVKVINALLGGATGGLGGLASTQNLAGILTGVLEGAGSSLRDDDFRDVRFNLGGTFDKPSVANIKVSPGEKQETTQQADQEEKTLQEKILEQVIPGATPALPQQQQPEPTEPEQTIKEKILEQLIPGTKPAPKQAPEQPAVQTGTSPLQKTEPEIKPSQEPAKPEPVEKSGPEPKPESKPEPKQEPGPEPEPEPEPVIEVIQEPSETPTPETQPSSVTTEGTAEEPAPEPELKPETETPAEPPSELPVEKPVGEAPATVPKPPLEEPVIEQPQEVVSEDMIE